MQQSYAKVSGVIEIVDGRRSGRGQPADECRRVHAARRDACTATSRCAADHGRQAQGAANPRQPRAQRQVRLRRVRAGRQAGHAAHRVSAAGVQISVIDNGVGIPPREHLADFQPRLHHARRGPRLRPAQRRARRPGTRRHSARRERRPRPRRAVSRSSCRCRPPPAPGLFASATRRQRRVPPSSVAGAASSLQLSGIHL